MDPSAPFARALSAPSTLPEELRSVDSDPLWAALLTSVQNVVLGEIRRARHPGLADPSARAQWPGLLDRLGHDVRVRIGREIVDELTVGTVDELWIAVSSVAGFSSDGIGIGESVAGSGAQNPDARGAASGDPAVQGRIADILEVLGDVVDRQLSDRFDAIPDDRRSEAVEFSLSDAGPAPEPLRDEGLVNALPPALAELPTRPTAVPAFEWSPQTAPAEAVSAPPPSAPGWRALPTAQTGRKPATFGRRAAAFLIDRAIVILITAAALLFFVWPAAAFASSAPRPAAGGILLASAFVGVAVVTLGWFVVVAWLVGRRGASPGKRLMRIEIVGFSSPGPIGFGRALLREVILYAFGIGSILTAWLPYASVFWDPSKQLRGWHDKAVDDIVVLAASL